MKKEWTDQQVEALLREAVGRSVPDIYRQVAAQEVPPLINEDHIVPPPVRRRRRRWPYVLALLALIAAGVLLYLLLSTAAILSIGADRDVELSVNRFQRVREARSNTEAGAAILAGQDLEGREVDDALEGVFDAMAAQGRLDGLDQLPVQVDGGSWQYNRTLLHIAQEELDEAVLAMGEAAADPGGAVQASPDPGGTAQASPAPAQSAAPAQPSAQTSAPPAQTPAQTSAAQGITEDQARQAALDRAGLSAQAVTFTKLKQDWEDGRRVYEIEMRTDTAEYECLVDAATGAVLQFQEGVLLGAAGGRVALSAQQARQIALDRAGVQADQVYGLQSELEEDDGRVYYEVEFEQNGREYQCEIDAATGAVLQEEWDD